MILATWLPKHEWNTVSQVLLRLTTYTRLAMNRTHLLSLASLLLACPVGSADTLVTVDGRILEVDKVRVEGESYRLMFEVGEILCPRELVASVEIEGDMSDYKPKDDRERKFLKDGFVRYKGKWMSKKGYQDLLEKRAQEARERTAEIAKHTDFENAWETESKHFILRSNTSEELLAYYTEMLEAYYSLMDKRIGIKPTPSMKRTKMTVNIFKNHEEFQEYAAEAYGSDEDEEDEGGGDSLLGFFSSTDQTLNFYHDYKDPGNSQITALHECTHLLTYLIDQDYWPQIWINEATADYYGTAIITRDKKGRMVIEPGELQVEQVLTVQEAIRAGNYTPLAKLFLIKNEDFDAFQYANAWTFVYFLQNTPKYAKNFSRFFKDLYTLKLKGYRAETLNMGSGDKTGSRKRYTPEDIGEALLKKLKVKDLGALEKQWVEFVKAIPLEGGEARFKRGFSRVFYGQGTAEEGLADLNAALEAGFQTAECYHARSTALMLTGDWPGALADLRHAIELNPLDASFREELASLLSGWYGGDDPPTAPKEALDEAELHFGLAALLDPENDELGKLYRGFVAARAK